MTFLPGQGLADQGGECGDLLRQHDWQNHPLGDNADWSESLLMNLGLVLEAMQPMALIWGPEQWLFYNDGYARILGSQHPGAFGHPIANLQGWQWDGLKVLAAAGFSGIATMDGHLSLPADQKHGKESCGASFTPIREASGKVLGVLCACVDTSASAWAEKAHRLERDALLQRFGVALGATAILHGPEHTFAYANENYEALLGIEGLVGRTAASAVPEPGRSGFIALLDHVYRTGETFTASGKPAVLKDIQNRVSDGRVVEFRYEALRDREDGPIHGVMVQAVDITELTEANRQEELIRQELAHRLKNQLAVVQAIVKQTLKTAPDLITATDALNARIAALAGAQDAVIAGGTGSASLGSLIENIVTLLGGHGSGRFEVSGPDVLLGGRQALALALILHELSTNAVKYGALSSDTGKVGLSWQSDKENDQFALIWKEFGGPAVSAPGHEGLGSKLIKAGISSRPRASATLHYDADGLRCEIVAALSDLEAH